MISAIGILLFSFLFLLRRNTALVTLSLVRNNDVDLPSPSGTAVKCSVPFFEKLTDHCL